MSETNGLRLMSKLQDGNLLGVRDSVVSDSIFLWMPIDATIFLTSLCSVSPLSLISGVIFISSTMLEP